MPCCEAEKYGNWCVDEHPLIEGEDGKRYCIFHAPKSLRRKAELDDFNPAVLRRIQSIAPNEICNLRGTVFPRHIDFSTVDEFPAISFKQAIFHGGASFKGQVFKGRATFSEAVFEEKVDFRRGEFRDRVRFRKTKFNDVDFGEVHFLDSADFWKSVFDGDVSFNRSEFHKKAAYNECEFHKRVQFNQTSFRTVFFNSALFQKNVLLEETSCSDWANFKGCVFEKACLFYKTEFMGVSFAHMCPEDVVTFDRADLRYNLFESSPIDSFRFIACRWPDVEERVCVYDARDIQEPAFTSLDEGGPRRGAFGKKAAREATREAHVYSLEDLFRRLKKNARTESDEVLASDWHYFEKEMQYRRLLQEDSNPLLRLFLSGYKVSSEYGESVNQAIKVLFFLILFPLLLVSFVAVCMTGLSMTPDWDVVDKVIGTWAKCLPFVKVDNSFEMPSILELLLSVAQVLIALQATLLSFAVRNKLRR